MPRLNKQIFIFLITFSLILIIVVFLAKGLGYSKSPIFFVGYTLRMFILAGIFSIFGLCALFFGEKILDSYYLPTSFKALNNCFKNGIKKIFKGKSIDLIISAIIFILAIFEVFFYNHQLSLSTKVLPYFLFDHNPLWSEGDENIYVVYDSSYMYVPLVWILMKIINSISLLVPFITYQGIIFGIVITLYYCNFRLGMGRVISLIFTLLIMVSSMQLDHLIPFWDKYYFRAPFVLSFIFVTVILIKRSFEPIGVLFWAALAGIIMGQGLMIRADLIVFSILIILTILFLLPQSKIINLQFKIMSIILFATVTMLSFQTCPRCSLFQNRSAHALINGTTIYEQQVAGLKLPKYDWNYLFLDTYTSSLSYAQAKAFNPNISYKNYGPIDEYSRLIIFNFPADLIAKFYGVVLKVVEMPFSNLLHPAGIKNELILSFYKWRGVFLSLFSGFSIWILFAAILIIGANCLRKGIFCIILIPPMMLLPFIHLEGYYSFYLEFISFWTLGFVSNQIIRCFILIWKRF